MPDMEEVPDMSLYPTPEQHAANPPETWQAVKVGERSWHLDDMTGATLAHCKTRKEAEALKLSGFYVNLYQREGRWMAGESVPNCKPYAQCVAEREAIARRAAS